MKLRKYENPKVKKTWKVVTILSCVFLFVPCLALATFGVLHLCGVTNMKDEEIHIYKVVFYDEETEEVYARFEVPRGEKVIYKDKPTKEGFKFKGWDTNHNSLPNVIPTRIFKDVIARALWTPIKENPYGGNK